jgi:predicted small metal-binding protein
MSMTIACREVGFDCDGRIEAADADAALAAAAAHVTNVHGLVDVTPDLVERVVAVMRTAEGSAVPMRAG